MGIWYRFIESVRQNRIVFHFDVLSAYNMFDTRTEKGDTRFSNSINLEGRARKTCSCRSSLLM